MIKGTEEGTIIQRKWTGWKLESKLNPRWSDWIEKRRQSRPELGCSTRGWKNNRVFLLHPRKILYLWAPLTPHRRKEPASNELVFCYVSINPEISTRRARSHQKPQPARSYNLFGNQAIIYWKHNTPLLSSPFFY